MKLGYLTFGRDDFAYGLSLVLEPLKGKHEVFRVTPKTARYVDKLLFSCFWWEHIYALADFLSAAGIKKSDKNRPEILVGGFNTFNPVPFLAYADKIFVGDGEVALADYLEGKGGDSIYEGQDSVQYATVPILRGHAHVTNEISRIELARGCKFHCKFCLVSHIKKYREVPLAEIEALLRRVKQRRVSLFAPEPHLYSDRAKVQRLCDALGKVRLDTDVRLENLNKRTNDVIPRFGLEGISERLRYSVGKHYSDEFVVSKIEEAMPTGLKGLTFYVILDLPGEAREDWESFSALLAKIGKIKGSERFTLFPYPNVFNPNPHTPLEFAPVHWERDYLSIWRNFFSSGRQVVDNPWNVKVAPRTRIPSPSGRILSMVSLRAGEEFHDIEAELTARGALVIKEGRPNCPSLGKLLRVLEGYGGVDNYCGEVPESRRLSAPWKKVIIPDPSSKEG